MQRDACLGDREQRQQTAQNTWTASIKEAGWHAEQNPVGKFSGTSEYFRTTNRFKEERFSYLRYYRSALALFATLYIAKRSLSYSLSYLIVWLGRVTYFISYHTPIFLAFALNNRSTPIERWDAFPKSIFTGPTTNVKGSPLHLCVGAIDDSAIKIRIPTGQSALRFFYRKGFYTLGVQAVCDSKYHFLYMSGVYFGEILDFTALLRSILWQKLAYRKLLLCDNRFHTRCIISTFPITPLHPVTHRVGFLQPATEHTLVAHTSHLHMDC